jgi:hypothetical protein
MIDIYYDTKNRILRNKLNITDNEKLKEVENYHFYSGFRKLKNDFSFDPEYIQIYIITFLKNYMIGLEIIDLLILKKKKWL